MPHRQSSPLSSASLRSASLSISEPCPACGHDVDVARFEPLSRATCETCGAQFVVGESIGQYQLLSVAGRGGMGIVYRAMDVSLNRPAALKLLRREQLTQDALVELDTEASIMAAINHPNVVKVLTTGTAYGRFYIAMELLESGTLDTVIQNNGAVAEADVLTIGIQAAEGLRAAHRHGLIHRDVKPGNILFAEDGTAKIADFGLAMAEEAAASADDSVIWGTPYYISPERLDRKPEDCRSDMYSLGATLFHAIAGRPPFEAKNASLVALKHLKNEAASVQSFAPWISGSTAFVINRLLQKDPKERYQNYEELIAHLQYAWEELDRSARTAAGKQRVVMEDASTQRHWSYLSIGFIVLCLIIGGTYLFLKPSNASKKSSLKKSVVVTPVGGDIDSRIASARQLLLSRMNTEAVSQLHDLGSDALTPQPQRQWALVLEGLGCLIAGESAPAHLAFQHLQKNPYENIKPETLQLRTTFGKIAQLGATDAPILGEVSREIDKNGPAAIELLIFGIKDWQLEKFDDANELLKQFKEASPTGELAWIRDFHSVADEYTADYADYQTAVALAKSVTTPETASSALLRIQNLQTDLRTKGTLHGRFDALIAGISAGAPQSAPQSQKPAAAGLPSSTATKTVPTPTPPVHAEPSAVVRPRIAKLCADWKFDEARAELVKIAGTPDSERRERYALFRKIDWLKSFQKALCLDLSENPSLRALAPRGGTAISSDIASATPESGIVFKSGKRLAWIDLSPESVMATTKQMVSRAHLSQHETAQRCWLAGVYSLLEGKRPEGIDFLQNAIRIQSSAADLLPLLSISFPSENLIRGHPLSASGSASPSEGAEKAGDGSLGSKWAPNRSGASAWLRVDLGSVRPISRWVIRQARSGKESAANRLTDFTLQSSSDGRAWIDVETVIKSDADVLCKDVTPFTARYIQLQMKSSTPASETPIFIQEFELYSPVTLTTAKTPASLFAAPIASGAPLLSSTDIGLKSDLPGSTESNAATGSTLIRTGGEDIWSTADHGRFVGRAIDGDSSISACILSLSDIGSEWTKAGLMYRDSYDPGAKNVFFATSPTGKIFLQCRSETDQEVADLGSASTMATFPMWLRITRTGDVFVASISEDGIAWKELTRTTATLNRTGIAGVAAASHWEGKQTTVKLDCLDLGADLVPIEN